MADSDSDRDSDNDNEMEIDADFDQLVERIRTQSATASGSDTERVTIRSLDEVSFDGLRELRSAIEDESAEPGSLAFYLSPTNAERVLEDVDATDFEALEERLGQPVCVEEEMPEDAILFMDPDAVDEESEIADPAAIACGTVGAA